MRRPAPRREPCSHGPPDTRGRIATVQCTLGSPSRRPPPLQFARGPRAPSPRHRVDLRSGGASAGPLVARQSPRCGPDCGLPASSATPLPADERQQARTSSGAPAGCCPARRRKGRSDAKQCGRRAGSSTRAPAGPNRGSVALSRRTKRTEDWGLMQHSSCIIHVAASPTARRRGAQALDGPTPTHARRVRGQARRPRAVPRRRPETRTLARSLLYMHTHTHHRHQPRARAPVTGRSPRPWPPGSP